MVPRGLKVRLRERVPEKGSAATGSGAGATIS